MRVHLQSEPLGEAVGKALDKMGQSQKTAAKSLGISQGQVSRLVSGDFRTKNKLVVKVCTYVQIDPDTFRERPAEKNDVGREALAALGRACQGPKRKTAVVIRVLRALEDLSPAG